MWWQCVGVPDSSHGLLASLRRFCSFPFFSDAMFGTSKHEADAAVGSLRAQAVVFAQSGTVLWDRIIQTLQKERLSTSEPRTNHSEQHENNKKLKGLVKL